MSTEAPSAQKKINLRRPDIMEAVSAQVLSHYRSELVERIRAGGGVLSADGLTVKLAKEFGFCYGVERAIDLAYAAKKHFSVVSPNTPIYLLGEIIHTPEVNDQIRNMGIQIIAPKPTDEDLSNLQSGDAVIIPAFGTEVGTRKKIEANTSQARAYGSGHYLVVFTLQETDYVCDYILNGGDKNEFLEKFKGAYSAGFDPDLHLQAVGVANQTTMLRGETEEVQRRIKQAMTKKYGEAAIEKHFRFFDTICGATQDRQDALEKMLLDPPNLLIVIGGYNSSNTSHLAEMGESKLPTFFIKNAGKMASDKLIVHYNQHLHKEVETRDWLPSGKITVGVTAGASCPNNLIEDTIRRLFELRGISVQELLKN